MNPRIGVDGSGFYYRKKKKKAGGGVNTYSMEIT